MLAIHSGRKALALGAWCALFFTLTVHTRAVQAADYLTGSGCSISKEGYLTDLAREYERRTGVKVYIRGGGSAAGIAELRAGKVDFAASCRPRDEQDPKDIEFVQVAWDALVFIVHPANPVINLSLDQIRAIYTGAVTNWKQLAGRDEPIAVFFSRSQHGLTGIEASLNAMVLKGAHPAPAPAITYLASTGIVEQMVEETAGGFAATGITSARKRRVKILQVNGVAPTKQAIMSGRYPFHRPLYILLSRSARPAVRKFVAFALSDIGQRFISSCNVLSLRDVP